MGIPPRKHRLNKENIGWATAFWGALPSDETNWIICWLTSWNCFQQEKMVIFTGCWHSEPAKRWFWPPANQPAQSGTKKRFKGNLLKHHQITAETHQIDPIWCFQMGDQPIESNRVSNVSKRSVENSARTKKMIPTPRHRSKALQAQGMFISPTPTSAASKQLQQGASHLLGFFPPSGGNIWD